MSQNIRATACSFGRHGSSWKVDGSGTATMSASSDRANPSSIEGFARSDEADMVAVPDPSPFQLLPWRPKEQAVARMFCDIRSPSGEPFEGDPRQVLKRTLARAAERGCTFYVSPEIEFFYFRDQHSTVPLDEGGYFDLTPLDGGTDPVSYTHLRAHETV